MRLFVLAAAAALPAFTLQAQQSRALFDAALLSVDPWSRMEALLDADRDGDLDAVGIWLRQNSRVHIEVKVHLNDGTGNFGNTTWYLSSESVAYDHVDDFVVAVGDWTGDGWPDIAAAGPNLLIAWRCEPGGNLPVEIARIPTTSAARQLVAFDLDGDALTDCAIRTLSGIEVWRSTGAGFAHAATWAGSAVDLLAGDFDADPRDELGLVRSNALDCVHWDGAALTNAGTMVHNVGASPMPARGDVDGDGDEDVVVFGMSSYSLLRRTGPAAFTLEPLVTGGPATGLADVDGDGDLDGVCCSSGGGSQVPENAAPSVFEVSLNDGTGRFAPARSIPNCGARHLAGAADVDSDGDVDLVAGRGVYFNRGELGREVEPVLRNTLGRLPRIADVDRDGDPDYDLAIPDLGLNRGDGTEQVASSVLPPVPGGGSWVGPGYHGDFDGDVDVDAIVGQVDQGFALVAMALLENRGGGSYAYGGPAGAPGVAFSPATFPFPPLHGEDQQIVRDLDGDGDLDLIANFVWAPFNIARAQVWWNDGQGFFTAGQLFPDWFVVGAADFDNDAIVDLVVSRYFATRTIMKGAPNRTWAISPQISWLSTSMSPTVVAAYADVDADGDVDILTDDSDRVLLCRNAGNGTLPSEYPLGSNDLIAWGGGLTRAFVADVDADGRKDLISWPAEFSGGTAAHIALQQPNGTFLLAATQVMDPSAFVDADGDGDLDAVGKRLVRNGLLTPETAGSRLQFGTRTPGLGGALPQIGETGPYRVSSLTHSVVRGFVGGAPAAYVFGVVHSDYVDVPFPGLAMYTLPAIVAVPVTLTGAPGAPGAGELDLAYVVPPAFAGLTLYKQAFALDATAPFGLTQTNGIAVAYGP